MPPHVSGRAARAAQRIPLLAIGLLSMVWGLWLGLVRLGWRLPLPQADDLIAHGPLMVCGFLGTLICLERAVGLGARWAYAAPLLTASGAVMLFVSPFGAAGKLLITLGSVVLVIIFAVVCRRQPTLFAFTMALGAIAWLVGNVRWLQPWSIYRLVGWWIVFLVLTIAGERLELNRVLRPSRGVRGTFVLAAAITLLGAVVTLGPSASDLRVLGAGLVGLAAWLGQNDIARRTVRQRGLTRFMAVALLVGYGWLGFAGVLMLAGGTLMPGPLYDATLHAVFLGFVMSMVFAHAPVIFPAVLGIPLQYRGAFYSHLALLHASIVLRVAGDLVESPGRWRAWGGLFNAVALVLFVFNTVRSLGPLRRAPAGGP